MHDIQDMLGAVIVEITGAENNSEEITFKSSDGRWWRFYHGQDCCESVSVEDVCGDVEDLLNSPILEAEEVSNYKGPEYEGDSHTWTFYKFGTIKGNVTIRWLGESNGYYSESVDLEETWHGDGLPKGYIYRTDVTPLENLTPYISMGGRYFEYRTWMDIHQVLAYKPKHTVTQ